LHAQLLSQAREAGVLEERQRMAREIHDTLAQGLIGIITQLEAVQQSAPGAARERRIDNAAKLARGSLSEARRSVQAMRPEALAANPRLPEALANVAKHAAAARVGITLSYMADVVTLDVRDDGVGFRPPGDLAAPPGVEDGDRAGDGDGGRSGGFGLTAMRQRVQRVAGTLAVESEPGIGTAVSASVPAIRRAQRSAAGRAGRRARRGGAVPGGGDPAARPGPLAGQGTAQQPGTGRARPRRPRRLEP
jgi:signal transduction histidine kinase